MDCWNVFWSIAVIIVCFSVVELTGRQPQLRGHWWGAGGLFPEPEDGSAVWPNQLCSGHHSGGTVSDISKLGSEESHFGDFVVDQNCLCVYMCVCAQVCCRGDWRFAILCVADDHWWSHLRYGSDQRVGGQREYWHINRIKVFCCSH